MATRSASGTVTGVAEDYAQLRTIPAIIGMVFGAFTIFQFGGIDPIHVNWFVDYTMTQDHAFLGSLAVYALAFMSSETRRFENYRRWEQVMIASGPAVMLAYQYMVEAQDFVANNPDWGGVLFAAIALISWGVAVR